MIKFSTLIVSQALFLLPTYWSNLVVVHSYRPCCFIIISPHSSGFLTFSIGERSRLNTNILFCHIMAVSCPSRYLSCYLFLCVCSPIHLSVCVCLSVPPPPPPPPCISDSHSLLFCSNACEYFSQVIIVSLSFSLHAFFT